MRLGFLLAVSSLTILCVTSCRNQEKTNAEQSTEYLATDKAVETDEAVETIQNLKIYTLKTEKTGIPLPQISLKTEDGTFLFSYDVLSSYLSVGKYEQSDNQLKLTTDDGMRHYLFEVVDENTIKFCEEGSSDVELTDKNIGVTIEDGAEFISDH